ncbi:MAG: SDR family oxidoreductase [Sulfitobacter sp.]
MRPVCLITGASAGIGAACALRVAQDGFDVVINYNTDRNGAEAAAQAAKDAGARCLIVQANVADPDAIIHMFEQIDTEFGHLDALVNNAGIVGQTARITDLTHDRLRQLFDVNVIGAILVAKAAVERMEPAGKGVIVNISSVAARLGSGNQYIDYAATKGAIDTFTRGLADEVAPSGIRVAAVAPGLIVTDLHAKGGEPGRAEKLGANTPMQRAGSATEIANAVSWLLSDQASYVTGTILTVSGGR